MESNSLGTEGISNREGSPPISNLHPPSSSSMGYCILVAHGLGRLCSLLGRWGTTVLSVSMLLLLLLFSWKTVQQNHVWLSREALFLYVEVACVYK